jgi:hypothetical protein
MAEGNSGRSAIAARERALIGNHQKLFGSAITARERVR